MFSNLKLKNGLEYSNSSNCGFAEILKKNSYLFLRVKNK